MHAGILASFVSVLHKWDDVTGFGIKRLSSSSQLFFYFTPTNKVLKVLFFLLTFFVGGANVQCTPSTVRPS